MFLSYLGRGHIEVLEEGRGVCVVPGHPGQHIRLVPGLVRLGGGGAGGGEVSPRVVIL